MALEVAHVYDENSNLVPLYIITNSDPVFEPEIPGFSILVNDSGQSVIISASSPRPLGGELTPSNGILIRTADTYGSNWADIDVSISNNSSYNLRVVVDFIITGDPLAVTYYLQRNPAYSFPYGFQLDAHQEVTNPLLQERKTGSSGSTIHQEANILVSVDIIQ